ncbi:hypothetical protein GCM10009602_13950 [Nocardiopsis tropica]
MSPTWIMTTAGAALVIGGLAAAYSASVMADPMGPAWIAAGVVVLFSAFAGAPGRPRDVPKAPQKPAGK